jgi:endonuclease/exonuclease/phosphatase family metal-dependent hydrolase
MERHHRVVVALLTLVALVLGTAASATPRRDTPVGADRTLTVMTRNVYFGADLTPVITAVASGAPVEEVLAAAAGAYAEAAASDFAFRAEALADEIATTRPDLVGVQESTVWTATPLDPSQPSLLLDVDFLAAIQKALADRGLHYEVVESVEGFDATLPLPVPGINALAGLTISDVLLRDASLPAADLRVTGVQSGTYATSVPDLVVPGVGALPFPRQWIAADVTVRGVDARVVTTHLESVSGAVRVGQAQELLGGPADTDRPTLVIGDLNSQVDGVTDDAPLPGPVPDAAHLLVLAGFDDLGPGGLTCCQDADLRNPVSDLSSRIDLVLGRGGFTVVDGTVTGAQPLAPSPLGVRYGSDHAGVTATVVLPR